MDPPVSKTLQCPKSVTGVTYAGLKGDTVKGRRVQYPNQIVRLLSFLANAIPTGRIAGFPDYGLAGQKRPTAGEIRIKPLGCAQNGITSAA
jgi:hypothetical protein